MLLHLRSLPSSATPRLSAPPPGVSSLRSSPHPRLVEAAGPSSRPACHSGASRHRLAPPASAAVLLDAVTSSSSPASPDSRSSSSSDGTSGSTSSNGNRGGGGDQDSEYHANVGKAVRTLREDLPHLFTQELDYSIYRPDVAAVAPDLPPVLGMSAYRRTHAVLRGAAKLVFRRVDMEVGRLWQPQEGLLRVRWSAIATPWISLGGGAMAEVDKPRFDFISTYKFDRRGIIYQHNLDTVIPPEPPAVLAQAGAVMSGARIGGHMNHEM